MLSIIINALAFVVITEVLPGFKISSRPMALVVALVYALLGLVLGLLSLPVLGPLMLMLAFLGPLATFPVFVIWFLFSVLVLIVTDKVLDGFEMDSTSTAMKAAAILALINMFASKLLS